MNNAAALRVIAVNYRTPRLAQRFIASVLTNLDVVAYIELVDTSDGPGAIHSNDMPAWIPVRYLPNVGYGPAINAAIHHPLEGTNPPLPPFLLICNADVELPADGIAPLLQLFIDDPRLGILGPRQVTPDGRIAHAGIPTLGATDGGRGYGEPDQGQYNERILDVEQISGSVMLIRTQAFQAIGGMASWRLYFEDAEICRAMTAAGYRVAYSGLRTFIHHVAASPEPDDTTRMALAIQGRQAFDRAAA